MLYELTMRGSYYGQEIVNRWNYVSTSIPASVSGSFGLVYAFGAIPTLGSFPIDRPFFLIMQYLNANFSITSIEGRAASLYDPEDFYERPFPTPYAGGHTGSDGMSPTMSYGFRTNRVRLDIARGTKRFPGVNEGQVATGGVVTTDMMALLAVVAESMSDTLSYDDEGTELLYQPAIASKQEYTTESGKRAYRYYPTLVEQMEHVATGIVWQPYSTVRTQTSRQYGRGV